MDLETIERLHKAGQMPDWIYYQVNNKSFTDNYWEQHKAILDSLNKERLRRDQEKKQQEQTEQEIQKQIQKQLIPLIDKSLNEIFKNF